MTSPFSQFCGPPQKCSLAAREMHTLRGSGEQGGLQERSLKPRELGNHYDGSCRERDGFKSKGAVKCSQPLRMCTSVASELMDMWNVCSSVA